jgi:hypothetical protein
MKLIRKEENDMAMKLSDMVNVSEIVPIRVRLKEVLDKPLILKRVEIIEGDFGDYAQFDVISVKTGEKLIVTAGNKDIVAIASAFPAELPEDIEFKFTKLDRSFLMVDIK